MYGTIDWSADVLPAIQDFMNSSLVHGALIAIAAIAIGVLAARGLIGVFFKRE